MKKITVCFALMLAILPGIVSALIETSGDGSAIRDEALAGRYAPGEVLVKFKAGPSAQALGKKTALKGHFVLAGPNRAGLMRLGVAPGQSVPEAVASYRGDPGVEYVQPNYIYRISAAPNDPQYGQLWAFRNTGQTIGTGTSVFGPNPGTPGCDINIESAWNHRTDCSSAVVAVVDTGVNYLQEDLSANMWDGGSSYPNHGYDFVSGSADPMDLQGHGTHVAGIIGAAGNNAAGTTGVCWAARIMAVRVLDATGNGYTSDIIEGIHFAVDHGAKVINLSLGGGGLDQAFGNAIAYAQAHDVVVVTAAGNEGADNDSGTTPTYPCNFPLANILCVAALDQSYGLAPFSNYGSSSVDVGAPGVNIRSTFAGSAGVIRDGLSAGWTESSGTGWGYGTPLIGAVPYRALVDPTTYPAGNYDNNADDRIWKQFNLAGADSAILNVTGAMYVGSGDSFRIVSSGGGGDPFSDPTLLYEARGAAAYPFPNAGSWDISGCIGANCSIGFQLVSDASLTSRGVAITEFAIETLAIDETHYETMNGTSMATPEVSGLAAMVRAHNPRYTYADAVDSIRNGGRTVAALAGKTTSGKAIDVMSILAFINPPAGLAYSVE